MRYKIAIVVPGMQVQPATYRTAPLGGSETAGLAMAYQLAARGHEVILFLKTEKEVAVDGVRWLPIDLYGGFAATTPHDVALLQRTAGLTIAAQQQARIVLLWCHDLARKRDAPLLLGGAWAIDRVLVVSEWMRQHYRQVTNLPADRLAVVPNGIDLEMIGHVLDLECRREPKGLLYCSRFERGLDVLLEKVMPKIWERDPDVTLDVCGYRHHVEHLAPFYAACLQAIGQLGPRVRWRGHLEKPQLYRLMRERELLVYPTPSTVQPRFAEVSCIVAMEAMACGLPVVASAHGALPETLGAAGALLVPGNALDPGHCDAMARRVVDVLADREQLELVRAIGEQRAKELQWTFSADRVEQLIGELFAQLNDNPFRLAAHFTHRQDIEAANRVVDLRMASGAPFDDRVDGPMALLRDRLHSRYGWSRTPAAMAEHYRNLVVPDYFPSLDQLRHQPERFTTEGGAERLQRVARVIKACPDVRRVLDYGCAHGESSILIHNIANVSVVGVDINPEVVERARGFSDWFSTDPTIVRFAPVTGTDDLAPLHGTFDAVFAGEVLEHVLDPFATLEDLHRCLRAGGLLVLTMPWGPWEAGHDNPPQHIREWTRDDLREIFGGMSQATIGSFYQGLQVTQEPCGYSIVTYRHQPDRPLGRIDWGRKLALQRPRQTLSLNMLVGGKAAHQTLHWSLASVADLCSEIIIGDTGMTEEAARIARSYGAVIVPVESPLVIGFDEARNRLLSRSSMDWVLWLDADERLVDADNLRKYLRDSPVDSYAINQHHWAIDSQPAPDRPARLFRNRPINGKPVRFFGMVHEHPETELNAGIGNTMIVNDLGIGHVGYLSERGRAGRFERNHPLLLRDMEKYPERQLQKHLMIRDLVIEAQSLLKISNGLLSEPVRRLLERAIELYREHYRGKPPAHHLDTLAYYSYAARALGLGFDVDVEMTVAKDGVGQVGPNAIRFASVEDFMADMSIRMKTETEKFEDELW